MKHDMNVKNALVTVNYALCKRVSVSAYFSSRNT